MQNFIDEIKPIHPWRFSFFLLVFVIIVVLLFLFLNKLLKDIKNADAMLLDIIGIGANIGADKIKDIAQELKEAIKDIKDNRYITLLNKYEKHLNILLQDIKDYKNL